MTIERFVVAMVLFHGLLLACSWWCVARWRASSRCGGPGREWALRLAREWSGLLLLAYGLALACAIVSNLESPRRLHLGSISGLLMSQALFGELPLVAAMFALLHARAGRPARAVALGSVALIVVAVYVDAFHVEPRRLEVRRHLVAAPAGAGLTQQIRILHISDIQTPVIGAHEERALRAGLQLRPDLIVLTGDYVQDLLGVASEQRAAADLRRLIARIGFDAPLGVYATEGDVGPPCREVFAGTRVRCVVDETMLIPVEGGRSLALTGLSRNRGRNRSAEWMRRLFEAGPAANDRIVISHAPDFVDAMPEPVALVLAGHTHGGQVALPFFGPLKTAIRLPRRYAGGLTNYAGIPLHVSRGVGMERGFAPPVRFFCPPEVCIVDLRLPIGPSRAGHSRRAPPAS